jgi:hypothetical protein
MNCGSRLLDDEVVQPLVGWLNAASADLKDEPMPAGPCVVYHRAGIEHLMDHPADHCRGEAIDDWVAMLQKYGLPCLSVTRSEWLDRVGPVDAMLLAAPAKLGFVVDEVVRRVAAGEGLFLMGHAETFDPALRERFAVEIEPPTRAKLASPATVVDDTAARLVEATGVLIEQRARSLKQASAWVAVINCLGGPVFARHRDRPIWIWETPEWGTPFTQHLSNRTVRSLETYVIVADAVTRYEPLRWTNRDWTRPVACFAWRYKDGSLGVMIANLETGMTGHSQFFCHGTLHSREPLGEFKTLTDTPPVKVVSEGNTLQLGLEPHKSAVLRFPLSR